MGVMTKEGRDSIVARGDGDSGTRGFGDACDFWGVPCDFWGVPCGLGSSVRVFLDGIMVNDLRDSSVFRGDSSVFRGDSGLPTMCCIVCG